MLDNGDDLQSPGDLGSSTTGKDGLDMQPEQRSTEAVRAAA